MDVLGALVSPSVAFGSGPPSFVELHAEPDFQSARVYRALRGGGGLATRAEGAEALEAAGFVVVPITLTRAERIYFSNVAPSVVQARQVWLVTCDGQIRNVEGKRRCGRIDGIQPVRVSEALETGLIGKKDMEPAARISRNVAGYRVFAPSRSFSSSAELRTALDTVRLWEATKALADRMRQAIQVSPIKASPAVETRLAAAYQMLAELAQPVDVVKAAYPQHTGSGNGRPAALGGVPLFAWAVVVLAVGVVAAVIYTAHGHKKAQAAYADLQKAHQEMMAPLAECVSDPSKTLAERLLCRQALGTMSDQAPAEPKSTGELWLDFVKTAAPVVGIGAGVYLFGPMIAEASRGMASSLRERRERAAEG